MHSLKVIIPFMSCVLNIFKEHLGSCFLCLWSSEHKLQVFAEKKMLSNIFGLRRKFSYILLNFVAHFFRV
jgi:hypothetical protein